MRVLVVAPVVLLAAAPAARADTIVFRRGTDVWRMAPDGSAQTPLTGGERRYEWPSAADDGTIVASDETGRLWRMTLDGVALGAPDPDRGHRRHRGRARGDADPRADLPRRRADRLRPGDRRRPDDAVDAGRGHRPRLPRPEHRPAVPGRAVVDRQRRAAAEPRRRVRRTRARRSRSTGSAAATAARTRGSATPTRRGRPASTPPPRAPGRGSRCSRTTPPTTTGRPTRVVLRLFAADGPGAPPAFRCELALDAQRHAPARPARRSRPTAPASPGPRATASTSPRSAP